MDTTTIKIIYTVYIYDLLITGDNTNISGGIVHPGETIPFSIWKVHELNE